MWGNVRLPKSDLLALLADLAAAEAERDTLRAEVREWLCVECRTVYPGPPAKGFACVICPRCEGDIGPRTEMELRQAEAERYRLTARAAALEAGLRDVLEIGDHEAHAQARALLAGPATP